jgi:putative MFS transporter
MQPNTLSGDASIADRLERLPFTPYQQRLAVILATCFAADSVGLSMVSYLLAPISQSLDFTAAEAGLAGSSVFAGIGVGATIAGLLSDRFGRKKVLTQSIYVWGIGCLLTALSWSLTSFVGFRFVTGLGLGAELPIAFAYVAELMPSNRRAEVTGWMQLGSAVATIAFNGLAWLAVGWLGAGPAWRSLFLLMFVVALIAIYVRQNLPESPRWYESRARHDQAHAATVEIERLVARYAVLPPPVATNAITAAPAGANPIRGLFAKGRAQRSLLAWAVWLLVQFGFYGITVWVGKLLVDRGMSISNSIFLGVIFSLAMVPAALGTGYVMERFGRKRVFSAILCALAVSAFAYGYAQSFLLVAIAGTIMQFFLKSVATSLYIYTPELFPTHIRTTGLGTSSSVGRIAAVAAPMGVPLLVANSGYSGAFIAFALSFGVAAVLVLALGPETRNRSIEEIAR